MRLVSALKWSFLAELASRAIQPVILVILAALLAPEDFGVITAALMVIAFSQIFWDAGMSKALIQRHSRVNDAATAAFWINCAIGMALVLVLFMSATHLASFVFHDHRVQPVLQVMAIQILLGAVSSVHNALLQKEMAFKKLLHVRLVTVALPGIASIPLAWSGFGYWALVAGSLAGQVSQTIMLWKISGWRPQCSFDRIVARELCIFGAWVTASGLLAWFYLWADSLIVGIYLGSHELGLYRTGNQLAMMLFALLFGPVTPVLYSYLSRINQDRQSIGEAISIVIRLITIVSIPIAFAVYSIANSFGPTMLGAPWHGIGLVFGVMALTHGFAWIAGMNGEVYRASGRPSVETLVMAIPMLVYLIGYLLSIRQGFDTFIWTRFALALVGLILQLAVLAKVVPFNLSRAMRNILVVSLLSGTTAIFAIWVFDRLENNFWWMLTLQSLITVGIIVFMFVILERDGYAQRFFRLLWTR